MSTVRENRESDKKGNIIFIDDRGYALIRHTGGKSGKGKSNKYSAGYCKSYWTLEQPSIELPKSCVIKMDGPI